MKAKYFFCLLFMVTCSIKTIAQEKSHVIILEPDGALNQNFYFSEILDERNMKENIGVAQKGLMNKQVPANFSEDFITHLKSYFSAVLPENAEAEPLTLKVHKLYISERTSAMAEVGTCEVELEFLKNENGKLFSLGNYKSKVEGKGADVTVKHDERIKKAIENCINEFASSNRKNINLAEVNAEISSNDSSKGLKFPLKKGLYFDFDDLINNSPKQDQSYRDKLIAQTKKMEHYQVYESTKNKRIKNLFGYSDGENIFLNASRYVQADYFVKSILMGRYIYFEDQYSPPAASSMGLLGALVTLHYTGIVLDTKTGVTTVLSNKNMENILSGYPALLNEYNSTKKTVEDDRKIIEKINALEKV